MEQRPTCPSCGDILIEGECVTHGVIIPRPPMREELVAKPYPLEIVAVADSPEPPMEPALPIDPEPRIEPGSPAEPEPTVAPEPAIAPVPAAPTRISADTVRIALVVGALVSLILIGVFALRSVSKATSDVGKRLDALSSVVGELSDDVTTDQTQVGKRLGAVEQKVAGQFDSAAIARRVRPSVFTIEAGQGLGSGFVIQSGSGGSTLVTNWHVIAAVGDGGRVRVKRSGVSAMNGVVTGIDVDNDLALVRVSRKFPALPRATDLPTTGEPVVVVGSPLGLGGTVTTGIVSGEREGFIQFSAPVSPGSSGGPVVNRDGKVIGVSDLKIIGFGAEGLSFAVPIVRICDLLLSC